MLYTRSSSATRPRYGHPSISAIVGAKLVLSRVLAMVGLRWGNWGVSLHSALGADALDLPRPVGGGRVGRHRQPLKRVRLDAAGEGAQGAHDGELPAAGGANTSGADPSSDGRHFLLFWFILYMWRSVYETELCCTRSVGSVLDEWRVCEERRVYLSLV